MAWNSWSSGESLHFLLREILFDLTKSDFLSMLSSELAQLNGETKEEFRPIESSYFSEEFFFVGNAIFGTAG